LRRWLDEGRLRTHRTSKEEINRLLAVFERDLADAGVKNLSTDRRFTTAYNAALMVSMAALAASGYRSAGEGHHFWTIQSLAFTLELDARRVRTFNKFRLKRNMTDYEAIGMISEQEVKEMIALARELHVTLIKWLKKNHPDLTAD